MIHKQRPRGRPRVGDYRLETTVPREVMEALKREGAECGQYHTRVAALVLCEWAKASTTGSAYSSHRNLIG